MALRRTFIHNIESGFTLIELLVVIGIFAILSTIGLFLSFDFYRTYSFNAEQATLVSVLTKARSQSLANINGEEHGVRVVSGKYFLIKGSGTTFTDDLEVPTGSATTVSGDDRIVFERLTAKAFKLSGSTRTACGNDANPCEVELTAQSICKSVTINSEGRLEWGSSCNP